MTIKRKLLAVAMAATVLFASLVTLAATLYPYATVLFSGIELVTNTVTSTTQGFIDITLKNINTTGLTFCISYDTNYIKLSDVEDNTPIVNPTTGSLETTFNLEHAYFEQNEEAFPTTPEASFIDVQNAAFIQYNAPIIGIADPETGHLVMNFLPRQEADAATEYIDMEDGRPIIVANTDAGVSLGRLSFEIVDPAAFAALSAAELAEVIKVVPFSSVPFIDGSGIEGEDTGVNIAYINDEGNLAWYSSEEKNIDYAFDIKAELKDVRADVSSATVSAYEIYKYEDYRDLFAYLNTYMNKLILTYTDGSEVPVMFEWTEADSNVAELPPWDPKGGDSYTVIQPYNEELDVIVTVNVTRVTLEDFITDNMHKTYLVGAEDYPQNFLDLQLPTKASPVLSPYLPNRGVADLDIDYYILSGELTGIDDLPQGMKDGVPGDYVFICKSSDADIMGNIYPWLTADVPAPEIRVTRTVVASQDDMPHTLAVKAETSASGVMTLEVTNSDGSDIPADTTFTLRMPNGELIDTAALTTNGRYTCSISGTTATITIQVDPAVNTEELLTRYINLGGRAGEFLIASTEPGKSMGGYTAFTSNARRNVYLPSDSGSDYTFDYSGLLSALFPVKAGTTLPTTVTLPRSEDRIATTYDGFTGTASGALATFTVKGWTVSGDINTVGSVVTLTGELADTDYTNYGHVYNDNAVSVTLKYLVAENGGTDTIEPISNFTYDTQQEGYGYEKLQTQGFAVKNTGVTDIYGLSAHISLANDAKSSEAFVQTTPLPGILAPGESAVLDITTKIGLPEGTYTSTVTILSNNNNALATFTITFTVTDQPVYNITLLVDGTAPDGTPLGTAVTVSGLYTSQAGLTIDLLATHEIDCSFTGWTTDADIEFVPDDKTEKPSFIMPAMDVTITAHFKENLGAKLRATDLWVKSVDETETYGLHDSSWLPVSFDPITREYFVAVPNNVESVIVGFVPRAEAVDATKTLTNAHGTEDPADPLPSYAINDPATGDTYYKSDPVPLEISPTKNVLTLSFTYNDPADDPDEETVTRSYVLNVYRKLKQSELMVFNPGNSPHGLILSDMSIDEADKSTVLADFIAKGYQFTDTVPEGASDELYNPKAWTGRNYDVDETALFVDISRPFTDPSYAMVTDSLGNEVTAVTKSTTVNLLAESDTALQNGSSDDFVYITPATIPLAASGSITELQNKRIRPDCYKLSYSFTDYDGSMVTISRPLILLPPMGDVNISATADSTDAGRIRGRYTVDLADHNNVPDYSVGGALFRYRICDVNKDGNLNNIDANHVRAGRLNAFYNNPTEGG